jgi:ADP-heptose:LPS heptosyltransferase
MARKIILTNFQSPGDIVMLTAAVRDLHACCPGEFITDVRTPCPDLWLNNPYLTPLDEGDSDVERLECHYPAIHQSNQRPFHFIHGFMEYLSERLGVHISPRIFKGDIHLSDEEKGAGPLFPELIDGGPYWLMAAGGKFDFTIKWWAPERYQEVVNRFAGRVQFVQVGEDGHHHPPLDGVIDLRGKTTLRELVHLMHHAQGVVCPVTLLMHLAAAVDTPFGKPPNRPCVVIAGGREPPHWEAYPFHQFLHTVGMLECCARGGCWRSRVLPLGDGDSKDHIHSLCANVVGTLPRCMDMITTGEVARAIEGYLSGGLYPACKL